MCIRDRCGPYKIYKYLTPVTVALYEPTTDNYVRRSHVSQIKYYHGNKHASEQEKKRSRKRIDVLRRIFAIL